MKKVFRKGSREYEFFHTREVRFLEFEDRAQAMGFLRPFVHDSHQMQALRQLLEAEPSLWNMRGMIDYSVLEKIADLLVSGRLRVMERYDYDLAGVHAVISDRPEESAPDEPPQEAPAHEPEPEPPPEEASNVAANQAAALVAAAASGAPVCEA